MVLRVVPGLDNPDFGDGSETVVLVTINSIYTVENKVDVKVLMVPEDALTDQRLDVLNTDLSVRLYPWNTLGDLNFLAGAAPAEVTTTLDLHGDPTTWPFDSYTTEAISADVLVGAGAEREFHPARVEVEAAIQGWDISSAAVPLRNILPGAPPPGAWIDIALVMWVVVALVAAMVTYVVAWFRQVD
ncbi:MAG: DUF4436 family protein [Mycolicibacterium sp.]